MIVLLTFLSVYNGMLSFFLPKRKTVPAIMYGIINFIDNYYCLYLSDVVSLTLHMEPNRLLRLYSTNTTSEIVLTDPTQSIISSDNLLAYYPEFMDRSNSGLAGIFINIEGIFPCATDLSVPGILKGPSCKLFTSEEDGFNLGKPIIELGDAGNIELASVFGPDIALYGLAISGCPTITKECLPTWFQSEIVCMLPRSKCA